MSTRASRTPTIDGAKRAGDDHSWRLGRVDGAGVVDAIREQSGRAQD